MEHPSFFGLTYQGNIGYTIKRNIEVMDLKIGCVLLAAGNARRFGSNKLTAQLDGISLIRRLWTPFPTALSRWL